MALLGLAMERAIAAGFVPLITPTLVKSEVMARRGLPRPPRRRGLPRRRRRPLPHGNLRGALAGYHADEILDLSAALSGMPGSQPATAGGRLYGKDTRGIIRVHQFNKIEMFVYCRLEDAAAEHRRLLDMEQDMLATIEVPYRIIDTAAGDLGGPAARKFDCEGWVPTRGRYRELTSTSNCTTFQARRLGTRVKGDAGNEVAATLNGTLATTRWLVALLENHQQSDGSVVVPDALRSRVGLDVLRRR